MLPRRTLISPYRPLALALAAGLALAGCTSSDGEPAADGGGAPSTGAGTTATAEPPPSEPAGGDAPDPCGLLTEDEVATAVGAEVTGTEGPFDEHQARNCTWAYPAEVTVSVWVGPEYYSPDTIEQGWEELPGIGDIAHQAEGPLCTTIFRAGDLVVQVLTGDGPDNACVDLARTAAGRL